MILASFNPAEEPYMQRIFLILLLSLGSVSLGGCSLSNIPFTYQVPVQQGNVITEEQISQLQRGMTQRQVRFILGTPAIEDTFRLNRWDYVHTERAGGGGDPDRLTVIFGDDGTLQELQGNLAPGTWDT